MASNPIEKSGWLDTVNGMPAVGTVAERSRRAEEVFIRLFAEMTEHQNPLDSDRGLADPSVFGGVIVQGGVTSGLINATVAHDLPGPGTVFLGVEWRFLVPVFPSDTITARVEVAEVRHDRPICKLNTTIRNQEGQICLEGTAKTYTVPLRRD